MMKEFASLRKFWILFLTVIPVNYLNQSVACDRSKVAPLNSRQLVFHSEASGNGDRLSNDNEDNRLADRITRPQRRKPIRKEEEEDVAFIEVSSDVRTHLTPSERLTVVTSQMRNPANSGDHVATSKHQASGAKRAPSPTHQRPMLASSGALSSRTTTTSTSQSPLHLQQQQVNTKEDYLNRLYFDSNMSLDFITHLGNIAYLVCRLRSIQQHDHLRVSWVRNMQILTSGEFRYTSDERFNATHVAGTHDWVLEIHNVKANDEGVYECQVNSEPKPASISVSLHVIVASIEIREAPQLFVGEGEQIKLTCQVEFSNSGEHFQSESYLHEPPNKFREFAISSQHYIYWYKDEVSLEYNNPRGGIRVERLENSTGLISMLYIEDAGESDSGSYTCKILSELNDLKPAQTQVIVGASPIDGANSGTSFGSSYLALAFVAFALQTFNQHRNQLILQAKSF